MGQCNAIGGDTLTVGGATYRHHNTIKNCTVKDCSMVGYKCEPGDHNTFENCTYEESSGWNPYWLNGSTKVWSRALTIFTWPATGTGRNEGHPSVGNKFIKCNFKKRGIVVANYGLETEFTECNLEMTAHTDETTNTYNVAVAHVGTLSHDVYGADGVKMINCTIKMLATSSGGRGVHLNQADNCTLTNNTIINNGVSSKERGYPTMERGIP